MSHSHSRSPCAPCSPSSRRLARPTGRSRPRSAKASARAVVAVASLALFGFLEPASAQQTAPRDGAPADGTASPAAQAPSAAPRPAAPPSAPADAAGPDGAVVGPDGPAADPDGAVAGPNGTAADADGAAASANATASHGTNRTDLDKARSELARARAQLEQAAREVARLSAEVSAPVVDEIRRRWSNAPWQRAQLGLVIENEDRGARVSAVTPGGPGDDAGIEVGDIILSIDGISLAAGDEPPVRELISHLADVDADDEVRLQIQRSGQTRDIIVVAQEAEPFVFAFGRPFDRWESHGPGESQESRESRGPSEAREFRDVREPRVREAREAREARAPREPFVFPPTFVRSVIQPFFGRWRDMELVSLTPDLGTYFGVNEGLLVVRAPKDASLPLHDGDVILSIGERKPTSPEHAMRILASFEPGETLRLTIMRQRQQQTLEVDLPTDGDTATSD